ncbi:MAG TPA: dethiobiotin synthase [Trebonia sp.]|jgi:dethiobiotin synthetase
MTDSDQRGVLFTAGTLFVTGTGTGVGKTIVTAAIAALARAAGRRVAVVKLAQTGVHDGPGSDIPDLETVTRLSGVTDTHELARFPDPLSPEAAARVSGLPPVGFARAAARIAALAADRDLVLVEGAGGLLVRYDGEGATIADLATVLNRQGLDAPALVVTAAGLGTLNHTALTLEAAAARKVRTAGVVIGSWPREPGLAERENLADLETLAGGPLAGLLPEGSGSLPPAGFLAAARDGLRPALGGRGRRISAGG